MWPEHAPSGHLRPWHLNITWKKMMNDKCEPNSPFLSRVCVRFLSTWPLAQTPFLLSLQILPTLSTLRLLLLLLLRRRRRRHVGSSSNWGICLRVPPPPPKKEERGEKKDDLESRQERDRRFPPGYFDENLKKLMQIPKHFINIEHYVNIFN